MSEKTHFILKLPSDLKKDFKIACTKNDTNMSDAIRTLMKQYIEENK